MEKQWFQSKALWFNIITIAIGFVEVISKTYPISPEMLAIIMGVGNIILRFLTGEPIAIGNKSFYKGK
jgi:hypothetical protein